ncbi:ribonuclease H-like domain-containing protein [bacterium]|nr:ribonuclease H-like domain-containing protein [bacterium]
MASDPERDDQELIQNLCHTWKKRLREAKEYEIKPEEDNAAGIVAPSVSATVSISDYDRAEHLKQSLLERYAESALEGVFRGIEIPTPQGICYRLQDKEPFSGKLPGLQRTREKLLNSLQLIHGIGQVTEPLLKSLGFYTINDLQEHPSFGLKARECLKIIDGMEPDCLAELVRHWFPQSHPLQFSLSCFYELSDLVFFDLETLGLTGDRPIILLGFATISGSCIDVEQYLIRDIKEEPGALTSFLQHLGPRTAFVSFNGKSFDLPYLESRLAYYGINADLCKPHFDMLHFSRRAWGKLYPDCRLGTLERLLFGMQREDDVPGALVPEFYEIYQRTGNPGPLVPIVTHNRQDLLTLVKLFLKLHEEWA